MAPAQHLEWFEDNINWFSDHATIEVLATDVPRCPGWTVENVLTHLAVGLGLGYPHALRSAPGTPDNEAFADVPWPAALPGGAGAIELFEREMLSCLEIFRATDPDWPCYAYGGSATAAFWFRRAAIETSLHRLDVADALGGAPSPLPVDRLEDAIDESIGFALPLARRWSGAESLPGVTVRPSGLDPVPLGDGPAVATISGEGVELLDALWGRSTDRVMISGDRHVALRWLKVVEQAFAGR